ncbi:MAG TPA: hypothetical protein DCP52_00490, partial [Elusimicrobia bacterium]|nr:hypothetical protein [Elusimicrobiota bacterium]
MKEDKNMKNIINLFVISLFALTAVPLCAQDATTPVQGLKNGLADGLKDGAKNGLAGGLKDGTKNGLKEGAKEGLKNGRQKSPKKEKAPKAHKAKKALGKTG